MLHCNSTDDSPRHHLCPTGESSWCKYQVALAKKETYHHKNPPIPEAIVQLLKPIYARLGSRELLAKCIDGYTQNANESFHSLVWKLCPKILHLGSKAVEVACALAVSQWNDGLIPSCQQEAWYSHHTLLCCPSPVKGHCPCKERKPQTEPRH